MKDKPKRRYFEMEPGKLYGLVLGKKGNFKDARITPISVEMLAQHFDPDSVGPDTRYRIVEGPVNGPADLNEMREL